jgi:GGDEF domain-containing protein
MAEAFSLQIADGREYVDLLVEAHERLADECVATAARGKSCFDEKSLLQLSTDLRAEVARCARGERRRPENEAAPFHRDTSVPDVQRTTTVNSEDGFEPMLESKVAMAIGQSRQNRLPLMLAILEIDGFSDLLVRMGPANAGDLIFELRERLVEWNDQCAPILLSDSRLAMLWEDSSRSESLQMARELLVKVRRSSSMSLSIGLATLEFAPKNYPARHLVAAALGCLSAAQLSGGNTVKSIAV